MVAEKNLLSWSQNSKCFSGEKHPALVVAEEQNFSMARNILMKHFTLVVRLFVW